MSSFSLLCRSIYHNYSKISYISKLSRHHIKFGQYLTFSTSTSKEDNFASIDLYNDDEFEEEIFDEEYDEEDYDGLLKIKNIQNVKLEDHRNEIEFIEHRIKTFENIYKQQCEERSKLPDTPIKIKLPDGTIKDGFKLKTTPLQIAEGISKGLAKAVIVAKVNGKLWDLTRPFEQDSDLILLKWDDDDAKQVFWHSSSHVLGQSMERFVIFWKFLTFLI